MGKEDHVMELYEGFEFLQIQRRDKILTVTMNRPEKLNAVRDSDHAELGRVLRTAQRDDEINVVVLRGEGRAFCVGGDKSLVEKTMSDPRELLRSQRDGREVVQAHVELDKPVVAAVQGRCSGAGATFALLSDIIVVERGTLIGDCHTLLGVAAGDGGVLTWPLAMGLIRAKRYLLSGEWIDAETAERYGLVTEVVEEGCATARAIEWAQQLAVLESSGLQFTKRAINHWLQLGMPAFNAGLAYEMLGFMQPETRQRVDKLFSDAETRQLGRTEVS
jgi:enoyl-CoA hydratase